MNSRSLDLRTEPVQLNSSGSTTAEEVYCFYEEHHRSNWLTPMLISISERQKPNTDKSTKRASAWIIANRRSMRLHSGSSHDACTGESEASPICELAYSGDAFSIVSTTDARRKENYKRQLPLK